MIKNKHSLSHVVNVSVTAVKPPANETMSREARLVQDSGLESQIHIEPDEEKIYPEFLSGDEFYTVKIWTGAGKADIDPDDSDNDRVIEETLSPEASEYSEARGAYLNIKIEYKTIVASRSYLY